MTELKLKTLIDRYELIQYEIRRIGCPNIDVLIYQIPGVQPMMDIKGIGRDTVAGFFAEVGGLNEYSHPRQIIKL
ncbi:hypothetical protein NYE65_00040 [Peribacillus sp. FSL R5-0717]|uniref:transposase n=1 Tax=Peribacillus sp. FSL R5-0717 TaxID=2975308 RepID=UPI0030FB33F9